MTKRKLQAGGSGSQYKIVYHLPKSINIPDDRDNILGFKRSYDAKTKKRPIITIGCSYVEGVELSYNKRFAAFLNKYTGRKTYNYGLSGTGTQMVYEQLSAPSIKDRSPDAEYIIYVFIYDHIIRNFRSLVTPYSTIIMPSYRLCNGELCKKNDYFYQLYTLFSAKVYLEQKSIFLVKQELYNGKPLFFKLLEESYKEMKSKYKDSKFVLVEFPDIPYCNSSNKQSRHLDNNDLNRLKEIGIIYINTEQLIGHDFCNIEKYRLSDKDHPNEEVWNEIVPALTKKLNL